MSNFLEKIMSRISQTIRFSD